MRYITIVFFSIILMLTASSNESLAQQSPNAISCSQFGLNWFTTPGTQFGCINLDDGSTKQKEDTANSIIVNGQTTMANRIDDLEEGVAISNALQTPDLIGGERGGLRFNWGSASSAVAIGVSGALVLSDNAFGKGERVVGSAGVAFSGNRVGANGGVQVTW